MRRLSGPIFLPRCEPGTLHALARVLTGAMLSLLITVQYGIAQQHTYFEWFEIVIGRSDQDGPRVY